MNSTGGPPGMSLSAASAAEIAVSGGTGGSAVAPPSAASPPRHMLFSNYTAVSPLMEPPCFENWVLCLRL